jgi:hypothetical protein
VRNSFKHLVVGSLLLLGGGACADLDVANLNDADAARALSTPGDVESLISGSFNSWFQGVHDYSGSSMFQSNAAFQHTAPWGNSGMEFYGRIPRVAIDNSTSAVEYGNFTRAWYRSYRAIAALADGLRALEDPDIADELGAESVAMDRAYGKFVQGMAHATVALMYDRGFVVTETTDLTEAQEPLEYDALMDVALGFFDDAISLSSATFTLPYNWMQDDITNQDLARYAHSQKARFRAQVARTAAERAAVDWGLVIADVDAGITETKYMEYDWDNGWYLESIDYSTDPGWGQLGYWMYGMADPNEDSAYKAWLALPIGDKNYNLPDGRLVLIHTPDTRFPQGADLAAQRANPGYAVRLTTEAEAGGTWKRPDRGVWRWSWYKAGPAFEDYWVEENWFQPEITIAEMDLLKAEALYWQSNMGGAATLINKTREAAGLNATDATGTNTSCVPRLPNGQCGDLWEMLKWEKRMETVWTGINMVGWFWDGRGWGDLWKDTPLQFPVPCQELEVLQMLPCNSYGGPGGEGGSPGSSYAFPFEG